MDPTQKDHPMAVQSPSSSSWSLPRFTPEEMDAALAAFEARELMELNSSHLPVFEIPEGEDSVDASNASSPLDSAADSET